MLSTLRIFITLSSIFISCTSEMGAAVVRTPTSVVASVEVIRMNAPVAFCCGTVARIQASSTFTSAWARALVKVKAEKTRLDRRGRVNIMWVSLNERSARRRLSWRVCDVAVDLRALKAESGEHFRLNEDGKLLSS